MHNEAEVSAELRHRLSNVLQLLTTLGRMRLSRTQDAEARRQVGWLLEATGALGVLHHRIGAAEAGDFSAFLTEMAPVWRRRIGRRPVRIEIEAFLTEMAPVWRRRIGRRPVRIEIEAEPVVVRENSASALAVIVNELVSNAIVHAFADGRPGCITVKLRGAGRDAAELAVSDDGAGYDGEAAHTSKLGLWLVSGLAEQLRGEMVTDSHAGVRARLNFPLN